MIAANHSLGYIIPGNSGFAISVCRLRERGCMSKGVHVRVFHDLELLRYGLRCAIERQLSFPAGMNLSLIHI